MSDIGSSSSSSSNKKVNTNKEDWKKPENNPHVTQVLSNQYIHRTDLPFCRVLKADAPSMVYRRRKGEVKTVIHWGQRKLLMSEIEFLTLFASRGDCVVYAGAAPGTHIRYLASLFDGVRFILVDPAPFTVKEDDVISLVNGLFTDELAEQIRDKEKETGGDILLISDIRSADPDELTEEETEEHVQRDMEFQQKWHMIMKPKASMFKFRLPWKPGKTYYLQGDIYLPVWGPITTTETRLIVKRDAPQVHYDNKKYEEQMFYFNTTTRVACYPHSVRGEGIDHCYDCRAEIAILTDYLSSEWTDNPLDEQEDAAIMWRKVSDMSREISSACSKERTLLSPNPDPEQRKKVINKNQRRFTDGKPAYLPQDQNRGEGSGKRRSDSFEEQSRDKRTKNELETKGTPQPPEILGWKIHMSSSYGQYYYFNPLTKETVWFNPEELPKPFIAEENTNTENTESSENTTTTTSSE
eukprot:TRINITY_DN4603_c0_g3_i8.p1 TRINITY_DN4603_c0_g3~~TRINITY_DN4603_c0_g3_i8.p1  ORF type:complete len:468 (+),score=94.60 TRINITY_DN4603_c0_g3_i8:176-1579(+)